MGGVDDDQQFKHTTPPAYASAMIRFISLNLLVSASLLALAFRLPLLGTKVAHCKCLNLAEADHAKRSLR
jgi:hypothetical protein